MQFGAEIATFFMLLGLACLSGIAIAILGIEISAACRQVSGRWSRTSSQTEPSMVRIGVAALVLASLVAAVLLALPSNPQAFVTASPDKLQTATN